MRAIAREPRGDEPTSELAEVRSPKPNLWLSLLAAALVATILGAISAWAYTGLPRAMHHPTPQAPLSKGYGTLGAWAWWDGAWYAGIADHGYTFTFGRRRQSATAFFPGYPLAIRAVRPLAGNSVLAGFLVSLGCGLGAAVLFAAWSGERFGREAGRLALAGLLLYPCAFYLFGVLYADSLFLLLALAAFQLLEHDRPVLAGLTAAFATATRPTGLAVVVGLWVRALERKGVLGTRPDRAAHIVDRRELARAALAQNAGLLLAPLGVLAYATYLWSRFGRPFTFIAAERGWHQEPGLKTWLKVAWFRRMARPPYLDPPHLHLVASLLATILAMGLVAVVFRRLGLGYGVYTLVLLVGSAASTKDFVGMGRYVLGAFPCFAVIGRLLSERPWLRLPVLVTSAAILAVTTELHARNMLIS